MSVTQSRQTVIRYATLVVLSPGETAPEALASALQRAGLPWQSLTPATLEGCLSEHHPEILIAVNPWSNPAMTQALATARAQAPATTLLGMTADTTPPIAQVQAAGMTACLTANDTPETILTWLTAAHTMAARQVALDTTCQNLHDLRVFTAEEYVPYRLEAMLESLLTTALGVVRREMPAALQDTLCGAVLLVGDDGQLLVRAADGPYAAYLDGMLPDDLQQSAYRVAETRELLAEGRYFLIPLGSDMRARGVLLFEGEGLPVATSDAVGLLVNYVSAMLENLLLYELAAIDSTTRVYTRTFILQRLYEAMKSTFRATQDLTVMMLDLNQFKSINDTYGHLTGDRVLREVGNVLQRALRETDIVGRYGGDEFLVVLPNTPTEGGLEAAHRIKRNMEALVIDLNGTELRLSISMGVGGIHPGDLPMDERGPIRPGHECFQKAMEMVIAQADGLMYRAKRTAASHIASGRPLSWVNLLGQGADDDKCPGGAAE